MLPLVATPFRVAIALLIACPFFLSMPAQAQQTPPGYVAVRAADGQTMLLLASADSDGDGIENGLEIDGYTFDVRSGDIVACDPAVDDPCYQTDPTDATTDGDPYTDYQEVSDVNLPDDIEAPFTHPLVAARPVISVILEGYDVIPITEITSTEGGEEAQEFTNTVTVTEEVGGSIKQSASLNPAELYKVETDISYSVSEARTQSSTSRFGRNWSKTRAVNTSEAARLKLRVRVRNIGSASALNVRPTINLVLGDKSIATFKLGEDDAIEELPPDAQYPQSGPAIVLERDSDGQDFILSLRELQAIQAGAPLSLAVTQVQATVKRWNVQTGAFDNDISWTGFESETTHSSLTLKVQTGTEDVREYQVFTKGASFDRVYTLREVLARVLDVDDRDGTTVIENRRYPDDWYLATSSQALLDAWDAAGRPANMLDVVVPANTRLFMMSPGDEPGPKVHLASFAPGMRQVYALAEPTGGFPITSATARVYVEGQLHELELAQRTDDAFFTNLPELSDGAEDDGTGRYGTVTFTDARGDTRTEDLFPSLNVSCADVKEYEPVLAQPGGEYLIFAEGDPDRPVEAYCEFFDEDGALREEPLESYWFPVESGTTARIMDVAFWDETHGLATAGGSMLRTGDGGKTWASAPADTEFGINGVAFVDASTAVGVGFLRSIVRTIDGGASWTEVHVDDCCILNDVTFIDPQTGVAIGESLASIYRTTDGGETWTDIGYDLSPTHLNEVVFPTPTTGIIVARENVASGITKGGILRSIDAGQTWQEVAIDSMSALGGVAFADAITGIAVGAVILRTTDGGASWSEVAQLEDGTYLWEVAFVDDQVGFAVGSQYDAENNTVRGVILRTDDAGQTWTDQYSRTNRRLYSVAAAGPNTVIVGGEEGVLLRTGSRGGHPAVGTAIVDEPVAAELPKQIALGQNYPNPFNPTTTIAFELAQSQAVRLEVFDLLGRRVALLVDGVYPAGQHQVPFDARDLASGVYLYRLVAGSVVEARTMVVMK